MYLAQTYNKLFSLLSTEATFVEENDLLYCMQNIYKMANSKDGCINQSSDNLLCFNAMSNSESASCISKVLEALKCACSEYKSISMPLSYMLDELVCNIQQHSLANMGILSVISTVICLTRSSPSMFRKILWSGSSRRAMCRSRP